MTSHGIDWANVGLCAGCAVFVAGFWTLAVMLLQALTS